MEKILIAVDNFTRQHHLKISEAVNTYASVQRLAQDRDPDVFKKAMSSAIVMVGWPAPAWLEESSIRLLQIGSSGWDAYEKAGLDKLGIRLCTGKGIYSIGVAEHCIAMMMYFTRNFKIHFQDQQNHIFQRHEPYGEVTGSTACIVGMGEIGKNLARRCKALEMKVIGVDIKSDMASSHLDRYYHISDVGVAVHLADHVFATLPGGISTIKFFNKGVLSRLRRDAFFYNVSRGTTVDQDYLYSILAEKRIRGAGLDVTEVEPLPPDSRWWNLDNVLITGHSAGLSAGWPDRLCDLVINNLVNFFNGKPLMNEINLTNQIYK